MKRMKNEEIGVEFIKSRGATINAGAGGEEEITMKYQSKQASLENQLAEVKLFQQVIQKHLKRMVEDGNIRVDPREQSIIDWFYDAGFDVKEIVEKQNFGHVSHEIKKYEIAFGFKDWSSMSGFAQRVLYSDCRGALLTSQDKRIREYVAKMIKKNEGQL